MTEQAYKTCSKCGCTSIEVEFYKSHSSYCRGCFNSYQALLHRLKRVNPYPVNHHCDICGKSEDDLPASFGSGGGKEKEKLKRITPWRLDHCHETGEFRGFLCNNCNVGLGKFKDDPVILINAIAYLQGHKEKEAL
jgi:hypothetical protein